MQVEAAGFSGALGLVFRVANAIEQRGRSSVRERDVEGISWSDFERVELRVGTVLEVADFPEARVPAWKLTIDFGDPVGVLRSSARITDRYGADELVGRQVLAVVNFPPKQIGPFMSECLVTGVPDANGAIVLVGPDAPVPNGARLA